jgi:hypothetical protein
LKGILGIFLCLFLGTITISSSNPHRGLFLKAFEEVPKGFMFSERFAQKPAEDKIEFRSELWLNE